MESIVQTPWRVGPIPARKITLHGRTQYLGNADAAVLLSDVVIKFWPNHPDGPCFIIENRRERRGDGNGKSDSTKV